MNIEKYNLAIVPPYSDDCPPLGAAWLLSYLDEHTEKKFGFIDLRHFTQPLYSPTFRPFGKKEESYVMDVPDLPLVLELIVAHSEKTSFAQRIKTSERIVHFCEERDMDYEQLTSYLESLENYFLQILPLFKKVEFIGFSVWNSNYLTTLMFCSLLKRQNPDIYIIGGGPQLTESKYSAQLTLVTGIMDSGVKGEGEKAIVEVFNHFLKGDTDKIKEIPRVMTKDPEEEATGCKSKVLRMAELTYPDFSRMDINGYQIDPKSRSMPLQLSRGCTDKCSFCSEWVFWEKFRPLSIDNALNQVRYLVENFGARHIRMMDSLINGHKKRMMAFVNGLLEEGFDIIWSGFMRADIEPDEAQLLYKSGFRHAFIGIESMNDETLKAMNKRRDYSDNIRSLVNFLENGISVNAGLIAGFPMDTEEAFKATVQFMADLQEKYDNLTFSVEPFLLSPNAPIFKFLNVNQLSIEYWSDYYLNLCPDLKEITSQIAYKITGPNQNIRKKLIDYANSHVDKSFNWPHNSHIQQSYLINEISNGYYTFKKTNYGQITEVLILSGEEKKYFEQLKESKKESYITNLKKQHILPFTINDFKYNPSRQVQFQLGCVIRNFGEQMVVGKFTSNSYFIFPAKIQKLIRDIIEGEVDTNGGMQPYLEFLKQEKLITFNQAVLEYA